jgi:hypothetical protein
MHDMEAYAGVALYLHSFLTSKLNGGEFLVFRIFRFTRVKIMAVTIYLWIG